MKYHVDTTGVVIMASTLKSIDDYAAEAAAKAKAAVKAAEKKDQ